MKLFWCCFFKELSDFGMSFFLMFFQLQAVAGLAADGRQIVARAKAEATNYQRFAF